MTLTEFMLARIAEDEARARTRFVSRRMIDGQMSEIALPVDNRAWAFPPGRVLAECEAKRRIVEMYLENESAARAYRSTRWADAMNDEDRLNWKKAEARLGQTEVIVRILALPYAEHPDYRPEWAPAGMVG